MYIKIIVLRNTVSCNRQLVIPGFKSIRSQVGSVCYLQRVIIKVFV